MHSDTRQPLFPANCIWICKTSAVKTEVQPAIALLDESLFCTLLSIFSWKRYLMFTFWSYETSFYNLFSTNSISEWHILSDLSCDRQGSLCFWQYIAIPSLPNTSKIFLTHILPTTVRFLDRIATNILTVLSSWMVPKIPCTDVCFATRMGIASSVWRRS